MVEFFYVNEVIFQIISKLIVIVYDFNSIKFVCLFVITLFYDAMGTFTYFLSNNEFCLKIMRVLRFGRFSSHI